MKAIIIADILELTSAINSVLYIYTNMWYYATVSYELPCDCRFLFGPLSRLVVKEIAQLQCGWHCKKRSDFYNKEQLMAICSTEPNQSRELSRTSTVRHDH